MNGIAVIAGAMVVVMIASELVLRGTKLQSGLSRILPTWAIVYIVTVFLLVRSTPVGPVAFTIFWAGLYLSWFGVRSHIESSILMRMMYLLRRQSRTQESLVAEYESHYGQ